MKEIKSKYQQKNYEEIEFVFHENSCRKCGLLFQMDDRYCQTYYASDDDTEYIKYYCPYCGTKNFYVP